MSEFYERYRKATGSEWITWNDDVISKQIRDGSFMTERIGNWPIEEEPMSPEQIIEAAVTRRMRCYYTDLRAEYIDGIGAQVMNELRHKGYVVVPKVI